jgi:NIMA (never in mitosis gene a)-related kinase
MDKYEVISEIGKGSFGRVYKVMRKQDGRILVWKELNYGKMQEKEKQMLVSEVNILRELRHPNITRYYDRIIDKESAKLYIVMEYCAGGDLAQ